MDSYLDLKKQIQSDWHEAMASNPNANPIMQMESRLFPGECLLWTGFPYRNVRWPRPWRNATRSRVAGWAILTVAVTIFATFLTISAPGLVFVIIFVFLAIAVHMLLLDPKSRRETYYGLTNQRALVVRKWANPRVQTLTLKEIKHIEFKVNEFGNGTIKCFAPGSPQWGKVNKKGDEVPLPLFRSISDARGVYELLQRQMKEAQSD